VAHDGPPWLVPDIGRRLPGRGVSVHPRRSCLEEAARRGFARSLKRAVSADAAELGRLAAEQYRRRAVGLLLAARRARALAVGATAVEEALAAGRSALVVFARDAAGPRADITRAAFGVCGVVVLETKAELGRLLGRDEVGVLSVLHRGLALEVEVAAARSAALSEEG
jgi:ribosomal protein L7Ae-like RNA K-turn-binding protein